MNEFWDPSDVLTDDSRMTLRVLTLGGVGRRWVTFWSWNSGHSMDGREKGQRSGSLTQLWKNVDWNSTEREKYA